MSDGSYQPMSLSLPQQRCAPVAAPVAAEDAFPDWGKGADFRRFQRERAKGVADVAGVAASPAISLPWDRGLEALQALPQPTFLSRERWEELLYDAACFSKDWGQAAVDLGWTKLELFGCNPNPRASRLDCDGLVILLNGRPVTELTAEFASIDVGGGKVNRFRRKQMLGAVPLWLGFAMEGGP